MGSYTHFWHSYRAPPLPRFSPFVCSGHWPSYASPFGPSRCAFFGLEGRCKHGQLQGPTRCLLFRWHSSPIISVFCIFPVSPIWNLVSPFNFTPRSLAEKILVTLPLPPLFLCCSFYGTVLPCLSRGVFSESACLDSHIHGFYAFDFRVFSASASILRAELGFSHPSFPVWLLRL